jgi:hypothetical protein
MAHVRRKFVDVFSSQGSAIAEEVIRRIALLYTIEKEIRGMAPQDRVAVRQARAKPVFDQLEEWLHAQLPRLSGKSPLAQAIRYALGPDAEGAAISQQRPPGVGQQRDLVRHWFKNNGRAPNALSSRWPSGEKIGCFQAPRGAAKPWLSPSR